MAGASTRGCSASLRSLGKNLEEKLFLIYWMGFLCAVSILLLLLLLLLVVVVVVENEEVEEGVEEEEEDDFLY